MEVQELWRYDQIPGGADISTSERRVWVFLMDKPNQSIIEISENLVMSIKEVEKIINSLLLKSAIFESEFGKYSAVIQN